MKQSLFLAAVLVVACQSTSQAQTIQYPVNIAGTIKNTAAAATASTNAQVADIAAALYAAQAAGLITGWNVAVTKNGPATQLGMGLPEMWYHPYSAVYTVTFRKIIIVRPGWLFGLPVPWVEPLPPKPVPPKAPGPKRWPDLQPVENNK